MGKAAARVTTPVPPLREGDRLTAREFFRRYEADPAVARAELIGGVVYVNACRVVINGEERVMPPISGGGHGRPQADATAWLWIYAAQTPVVAAFGPTTVRMADNTTPEPDALLTILPECGGPGGVGRRRLFHRPPGTRRRGGQ